MKLINPEISVIIPVFKAKGTLARAINSIIKQNLNQDKIEIILSVDDNLSYYEFKELHKNIRILNPSGKRKTGAGQARNRAIKGSRGKIIGFLDADDTWSSNYLKELKPIANRYGVAISKTQILNEEGEPICLLDPKINIDIKHFGLIPGSFHPLVIKKLSDPFPDGPSQDVVHSIKILRKIRYRYKFPLNAKYELWLNKMSKTAEKRFSKLVDNSYKSWRYYYLTHPNSKQRKTNHDIIKVFQLRINWNNRFIKNNNNERFYEFLADKL